MRLVLLLMASAGVAVLLACCVALSLGLGIRPAVAADSTIPASYTVETIGSLGSNVFAEAINDSGQVVGYSRFDPASEEYHPFLYGNHVMKDLGTFGGNFGAAFGINNFGQVVGSAARYGGNSNAFLYENNTMKGLGTPAPDIPGPHNSSAYDINDLGQVVGALWLGTSNSYWHATLFEGNIAKDLGVLPGGRESLAGEVQSHRQPGTRHIREGTGRLGVPEVARDRVRLGTPNWYR